MLCMSSDKHIYDSTQKILSDWNGGADALRLNSNVAFIETVGATPFTSDGKLLLHKNVGWFNFSSRLSLVTFT